MASDLRTIDRMAHQQRGVLTRTQLLSAGASGRTIERWLGAGRIIPVHRGVYRLPSHPKTWEQRVTAAVLAVGPPVAASRRTAGRLWRLEGLEGDAVELVVPAERSTLRAVTLVRSRSLSRRDVVVVDGIPRTTPPRTMVDLASVLSMEALEIVLDDALRRRMFTVGTMSRRIGRSSTRGRRGIGMFRDLLGDRTKDGPSGSGWETRLRRLLVTARFPVPIRQHVVRDSSGRFVGRIDLAYPELKVGLEFDGFRYHAGRRAWERDVTRQNALEDLGWRFRRFTSTAVRRRPDEILASVERVIRQASVRS